MRNFLLLVAIIFASFLNQAFGQIGINTSSPNPKSVLDIVSKNNNSGVLMPRLTKTQIDAMTSGLTSAEDGLTVYNTTEKCYNLWKANKWKSLCGDKPSSSFVIDDCAGASVQGTYVKNTPLTSSNTYTIKVNVTQVGPYSISGSTGNGYSFSKFGTFTATGQQTVILDGTGTPIAAAGDVLTLTFNGSAASVSCTLPTITVVDNAVMTMDCANAVVFGNYGYPNMPANSSNYIEVPVYNITTPGSVLVETNTNNGIKFSSGIIAITTATTSIKLLAQGTPLATGNFSYTYTYGTSTCTVNIRVYDAPGSLGAPASRCLSILQQNPAATDGEYYIRGQQDVPVKTYCDMTNGGFTLFRSFSEKAFFGIDNQGNTPLAQSFQNLDNNISNGYGNSIDYKNFFLPTGQTYSTDQTEFVRQNISNSETKNTYRVRIVQDEAHLHDNNDAWANDNFAVIDFAFANIEDLIRGQLPSQGTKLKITSKIFGKNYSWDLSHTGNYVSYNGQSWGGATFWASTGFNGIKNYVDATYTTPAYFPPSSVFTYTNPNGTTTTNNVANLLNIFVGGSNGIYMINHHFGKCKSADTYNASTGDDYTGIQKCIWNDGQHTALHVTPHSFNNGEGRYMQWFVK